MQIKTTVKFHFTLVRMAITQKHHHHHQMLVRIQGGGQGTHIHSWKECKLIHPLWKAIWRLLKKTKCRSAI
jgi:hypothetical protein